MKKVLIIIFVLITLSGYSQGCKYKRNEVDKFTGKFIIETKPKPFYPGVANYLDVSALKINSYRYLAFNISMKSIFSIDEGNELMLLLSDSTIILKNMKYVISDIKGYGNNYIYKAKIEFHINDNVFELLKNETITDFRIYLNDGYFEKPLKEKNGNVLKKILPCIE